MKSGLALGLPLLGVLLGSGNAWAGSETTGGDGGAVSTPNARRALTVELDGRPVLLGVGYGPYRQGQRPGGPDPSRSELLEDLRIIAAHWGMIRLYSSRGPSEDIVRLIHRRQLPIRVVLGAWISADDPEANAAEVEAAIHLARAYPNEVVAVSIGNETQVFWSGHKSPLPDLLGHIRDVRRAIEQPVTTADDYNFWNRPESQQVAAEVDFLLLHAYAMWNRQTLADAVPWTAATVASIRGHHPDLPIVLGETGWATTMHPSGDAKTQIIAPAGEAEQAVAYAAMTAWTQEQGLPLFWFSAFDEPWKGSDHPDEIEKHWGLYDVDRRPKQAVSGGQDER